MLRSPPQKRAVVEFLAVAFILTTFCALPSAQAWEPYDTDQSDIQIYFRDAPSHPDLLEYRAVTQLESTASTLIRVIRDVPAQKEWVYKLESSDITRIDDSTVLLTSYYSIPFAQDRVSVMRSVFCHHSELEQYRIVAKIVPYDGAVRSGYFRITRGEASWKIHEVSPGMTEVVTQAFVDLGGMFLLSNWKPLVKNGPIQTLMNLKSQVKKDKYKFAAKQPLSPEPKECVEVL